MHENTLYIKSAKGIEEIERRTYRLPPKLRALLIMVDGAAKAGELIARAAPLGDVAGMLQQLATGGFVEDTATLVAPRAADTAAVREALSVAAYEVLGPDGEMMAAKFKKLATVPEMEAYLDTCLDLIHQGAGRKKAEDFLGRLETLQRQGLLSRVPARRQPSPTAAPAAPVAAAVPAPAPAQAEPASARRPLADIKGFMARFVNDTLGPGGEMLAIKIEKCKEYDQILQLAESTQQAVQAMAGKRKAEEFSLKLQEYLN